MAARSTAGVVDSEAMASRLAGFKAAKSGAPNQQVRRVLRGTISALTLSRTAVLHDRLASTCWRTMILAAVTRRMAAPMIGGVL